MKNRVSASRIAWLAILAVVWHALLPLAHAAGAQKGVLSSICTTGSAQFERLSPAGSQDAPAADLLKQCSLCASGAHCALPEAPTQAFAPDARLAHVQAAPAARSATHATAWLNFSPRAPPAHA